jgi:hypothetical protein
MLSVKNIKYADFFFIVCIWINIGVMCYLAFTNTIKHNQKNTKEIKPDLIGKEITVCGKRGVITSTMDDEVRIFFIDTETKVWLPLKVCKFQDNQVEKDTK